MTKLASLLDHLQSHGYAPDDDGWFELIASGVGSVRVISGDNGTEVFVFDKFRACEWQAKFSQGTPEPAIVTTLLAAEGQLAYWRGGPVTP